MQKEKNIKRILLSLDQSDYDQIVAIACRVPAIQLVTPESFKAYASLGSYVRRNVTPPASCLARCFPFINMGSVGNDLNELDAIVKVIHA